MEDISITDKNFVKIHFSKAINIPEISPQDIFDVTIAQLGKNREGKPIITTSPDWVNNWIVTFNNQIHYKNKNTIFKSSNAYKEDAINSIKFRKSKENDHDEKKDYSVFVENQDYFSYFRNLISNLKDSLFFPIDFKEKSQISPLLIQHFTSC